MGQPNYSQVGSASDVKLANPQQYGSYMGQLSGAMGAGGGFGSSYGKVMDTAQNYDNLIARMMGGGGMYQTMQNATNNFDPNAATAAFLSFNPQMQQLADQSLSGVAQSTRAQAQGMANDARRQAASELASAGLLNSGAGVGAMTQATVNPMLAAETQLANTRAGYLGNLQQQLYGGLSNAYGQAGQQAMQAAQLGGQMQQAQGSQYGNAAQLLSGLFGYGAQMSQPEYWQPQYAKDRDIFDYMQLLVGGAEGIGKGVGAAAMGFGGIPVA